jgi:hypothetical protein
MDDIVLEGSENTLEVNSYMMIETFVFCVYQGFPEDGIDVFVSDGGTVLAEVFSNEYAVSAI